MTWVGLVALLISGCVAPPIPRPGPGSSTSSTSAPTTSTAPTKPVFDASPYDFWQLHGPPLIYLNYGDSGQSMRQLLERADDVFIGRVRRVDPGSYGGTSTVVTAEANDGRTHTFHLMRTPLVTIEMVRAKIPSGEFVFVLNAGVITPGVAKTTDHCAHQYYCVLTIRGGQVLVPIFGAGLRSPSTTLPQLLNELT